MTRITIEEPSELVIHRLYKVSPEELLKAWAADGGQRQVFWTNGVLMLPFKMAMLLSAIVETDFINGKEHWQELFCADMEQFTKSIEVDEAHLKGTKMYITDASNLPLYCEVAAWLRMRYATDRIPITEQEKFPSNQM
jgi:hypothetical protein